MQLPGVQDTARAKDILGRTATLEVRLVDEEAMRSGSTLNVDVFPERKRDGTVTHGADEEAGDRHRRPVHRRARRPSTRTSGRRCRSTSTRPAAASCARRTRENIKHLMAIILFEKGKGEAISVATIQGEFGSRFQITGTFNTAETNNLALLIRAGALAAPMEIIEERTVGPSARQGQHREGLQRDALGLHRHRRLHVASTTRCFGVISSVGARREPAVPDRRCCRCMQATLTLPGIAAIALTLGMAIDANVLINERIREELRGGADAAGGDRRGLRARLGDDLSTPT